MTEFGGRDVEIREAEREDLPAIVRLLADDPLGSRRERYDDPLPEPYYQAFEAIRAQGGNYLLVATADGKVVGCLQLTIVQTFSRLGAPRALIEGVRVGASVRGIKLGERMIRYAIERSRAAGCGLVQLTSDNSRVDARRFYERLGFVASHVGMKLALD